MDLPINTRKNRSAFLCRRRNSRGKDWSVTVEYIDLVNRIITAEHSAKEIAQEAKEREVSLDADLAQEEASMRERYFARAKHRIAQVEETERQAADEYIALWDKKLSDTMDAVETAYETNKDAWVETLFSMIVGGTV